MRAPMLALVALSSLPTFATGEEVVQLRVGEARPGFGTVRPICDAPAVAVIEAGVLKGVGPGETLCSVATVQAQGTRRLYRVVVKAPEPANPAGAGTTKVEQGQGASRRDPEGSPPAR